MLINGFGQQFGLLSGGCLEADIVRHARKVMLDGQPQTLVYDATDEDDWSYQLGIGCGGKIYIMLQPITVENDLGLSCMSAALKQRESGVYRQKVGGIEAHFTMEKRLNFSQSYLEHCGDDDWLVTPIIPEPHLLVVGGGIDAFPLVSIAKELGWMVTVADPRSSHARRDVFPNADRVLREIDSRLSAYITAEKVDAAILMSHNIKIDAQALCSAQQTPLRYMSLLGPKHRYQWVLDEAGLREADLSCPVSAPAGLSIGGQLPESIALSILAECHAALHQQSQRSSLRVVSG